MITQGCDSRCLANVKARLEVSAYRVMHQIASVRIDIAFT